MNALITSSTLIGATLAFAGTVRAQETKIQRSDLPPAVQQAVAANSQGATIRGFSRERENGHTYYEAETSVDGRGKDVLMDSTGAIVEIEEQVTMGSLPAAVQSALTHKAGAGHVTRIESLTKHGTLVAYEAQVMTGRKHSEIQVGPAGETLSHEE
jgi:hypothetical protein